MQIIIDRKQKEVNISFLVFTTDHLEQSRIVFPPAAVIQAFSEIVAPIHEKISHCRKENRELTKLHDWLHPMLINGQVPSYKGDTMAKKDLLLIQYKAF